MPSSILLSILSFFILLTSCSSSGLYRPLPKNLESKVSLQGYKHIRAWGDAPSETMKRSAEQSIEQIKKANHGAIPKVINALAISGGGADGAFGAGVLWGWSQTGIRPTFHLVSGISTGALIAPFAFLGPEYDGQLKQLYTTLSDGEVYELNNPLTLISAYFKPILNRSIASNKPMKKLMEQIVNQRMMEKIAKEHLKGRRLFIGTSQINAQRLVIWDIGAIAASGNPGALKLIHKILLASSALPGIFPPEYFQVMANGTSYQEMHLDGGIETQVMLYEEAIIPFATIYIHHEPQSVKKLYVIRNRKVNPEWSKIKPRLRYIIERAISTLTKTQGIGDLYRLYAFSKRDKVDYNLIYIPEYFTDEAQSFYDKKYMQHLFQVGIKEGKQMRWKKYPPGLYASQR